MEWERNHFSAFFLSVNLTKWHVENVNNRIQQLLAICKHCEAGDKVS